MKYFVTLPSGNEHVVDITEDAREETHVSVNGESITAEAVRYGGSATGPQAGSKTRVGRGATSVRVGARMVELWLEADPPEVGVIANGKRFFAKVESERMRIQAAAKGGAVNEGRVLSPMPGRVLRVLVNVGDVVAEKQPVVVVEAMKMENDLLAPRAGKVTKVQAMTGASVESGAVLLEIEG